jgi:CheY-like chemotaxis protein
MHGGVIEARSEGVGKGSEFVARLPAYAGAAASPVESIQAPTVPASKPPAAVSGTGKRVLVVDDNVDTAQSLARLLSRRGYDVAVAHDGPSGERVADRFAPEICLLDIGLPGFDGYELARRLRTGGPCQNAMIIAISGYAQHGDRTQSRVAGFDAHFAKPVDLDKLFEQLGSPQGTSEAKANR